MITLPNINPDALTCWQHPLMSGATKGSSHEEATWSEQAAKQFDLQLLSDQVSCEAGLCMCGADFLSGTPQHACASTTGSHSEVPAHRSMQQADRIDGMHTSSTVRRSVLMARRACKHVICMQCTQHACCCNATLKSCTHAPTAGAKRGEYGLEYPAINDMQAEAALKELADDMVSYREEGYGVNGSLESGECILDVVPQGVSAVLAAAANLTDAVSCPHK